MRKAVPAFLCAFAIGAGAVSAQEEPESYTPLKLELTLSKPQEGSGPASYVLYLLADGGSTELRSGREVPVPVTSLVSAEGESEPAVPTRPVTSFQYRNVGFNLMARAWKHRDRFRIFLTLERSSLLETSGLQPSFETFNVQNEIVLRDGETARLVEGSDPPVGEPLHIDVKLEVVK